MLAELPHLPFVWHFKEAPQACVRRGTWPELAALWEGADEVLCATEEEARLVRAGPARPAATRPARRCSTATCRWPSGSRPSARPRLSDADGAVHTAVLGRPLGVDAELLVRLGRAGVHVHLHGQVRDHGPAAGWAAAVRDAQAQVDTVHLHPKVEQPDWVRVLSRYDAGWLHRFRARNGGDLRRAVWDDLNAPARIPTYASAGLPMLLQSSPGSVVAAERLLGDSAVRLRRRRPPRRAAARPGCARSAPPTRPGTAARGSPSTRTSTGWWGSSRRPPGVSDRDRG